VLHWRGVLESGAREQPSRATPGHALLVQLLKDKEAQAIERLLRLLALQYRGEDFRDIYRGLRARDRGSGRAAASCSRTCCGRRSAIWSTSKPPPRGCGALCSHAPRPGC
jgi:hypothetical protein